MGVDMEIRPLKKRKLSDDVVDQLKERIQSGAFPPGSKLPTEKELVEQFGVSRASIREALSILASAKIIEIRQGEGSFVLKVSLSQLIPPVAVSMLSFPKDILHFLEVRTVLEATAAELAAERSTSADWVAMQRAADRYLSEIESRQMGASGDFDLHQAIAVSTRNPALVELMNRISDLIREGMRYSLGQNAGNLFRSYQVHREHQAIIDAIRARDKDQARAAMTLHLENVRQKIESQFDRLNADGAPASGAPNDSGAPADSILPASGAPAGDRRGTHGGRPDQPTARRRPGAAPRSRRESGDIP